MLLIDWNNKTYLYAVFGSPGSKSTWEVGLDQRELSVGCSQRKGFESKDPVHSRDLCCYETHTPICFAILRKPPLLGLKISYLYLPFENSHDPMIVFLLPVWLYALYTDKTTPPVITSFRLHQIAKGAFPIASCPRSQHALLDIPTCFS
jgi:hypothetical protein